MMLFCDSPFDLTAWVGMEKANHLLFVIDEKRSRDRVYVFDCR